MKKTKLRKSMATIVALVMILSSLVAPATVFANESAAEALDAPVNLVLNRGHVETLAFGGPIGLSWDEVENRSTFTVFAFRDGNDYDSDEAYAYISDIDALYLDVNDAFAFELNDGPFWFRVQALAEEYDDSELSEAAGPFWYAYHSDEFADDPEGSFAILDDPDIPVLVLDTRRPVEREDQGNIIGDTHTPWPNAVGVEEGITHADFQDAVIAAWEYFIENTLTEDQRENLDPDMDYRDIHIFVY